MFTKSNKVENQRQQPRSSSEEIAARAYQIYERAGRPPGHELDHWLAAEAQLANERAKTTAISSKLTQPLAITSHPANRISHAPIRLPAPSPR